MYVLCVTYAHYALVQDRYADARELPRVDTSQDWLLSSGTEQDGFTVLEFSRDWVTCDDRDNPIEVRLTYIRSYVNVHVCLCSNYNMFENCPGTLQQH